MTLDTRILAEHRALLAEKLEAVERLTGHLEFSLGCNPYPLDSLSLLDPVLLESVSALVERFGKLQDLLSGVFRELVLLSGEDAVDMNRVFSRMEKIGILENVDHWRAMRVPRNLGAHEYDPDDAGRTRFINALAADAPTLIQIAVRAVDYAKATFFR
ncbi:MAG: hypothetical protein J0M01_10885 [Dechloromonas sp.]|jgi:hypothetical protein|nr:hypothetical protein [Dechloromonas sp.]